MSKKNKMSKKEYIFGGIIILIFLFIILSLTSCDKDKDENNKNKKENFIASEFTGINPSPNSCSKNYRLFSSDLENTFAYPRNRCQACQGYNKIEYEFFCPHNCRDENGLPLCDQGKMM